ncbi:MAG: class B sortase, partial [Clostridia bacterium]|nr:class B sortase [Clostridia bacterium]
FAGMIYTQSCNSLDFSDPVTVVYGHNMRSTTMFSTLHYFEDASFFESHDTFYIYTTDRVLTYKIVSAYKYDNRHIMNSFDFSDPEVLRSYQQYTLSPLTTLSNVRSGITLDENSKLVVLSTCMSNDKSSRYLVNGVLVSDVPITQEK